jgi:hypothetical protein
MGELELQRQERNPPRGHECGFDFAASIEVAREEKGSEKKRLQF